MNLDDAETSPASLVSSLAAAAPTKCDLPERLVNHYRELLRAHVVMGVGNLAGEMTALAGLLAEADISAQQTMQLHVHVLEEFDRHAGQSQRPARDESGRSVGRGSDGPSGGRLSAAVL